MNLHSIPFTLYHNKNYYNWFYFLLKKDMELNWPPI